MIWLDIIDAGAWEEGADEWALLGWADDARKGRRRRRKR